MSYKWLPTFWVFTGAVAGFCAATLLASSDAEAQERRKLLPRNQPAPKVEKTPQVAEGPVRDWVRERIALRIIKNKTVDQAMKVGVNGKKLTREEAEAAYERMHEDLGDDGIMAVAADAVPPIAGKLAGGRLSDFLDWLLANAPAIIELLMKILPLFLENAPAEEAQAALEFLRHLFV